MDPSVRDILVGADRLGEWEFPSDASGDLQTEVNSLVSELEAIIGCELDVDRNVQDASFLTDIGLLDDRYYDRKSGTGAISYAFSFRFSNFGRLFTLHGTDTERCFREYKLGDALEFIRSHGFVFVASAELDSPYDGVNGPNNPISGSALTWWIRFFDYI